MLHKEGAPPDDPKRLAAAQGRHELGLGRREPEQAPQARDLVRRLGEDDLGVGVGDQALRDPRLPRSLRAGRTEVGEPGAGR